MNNRIEAVTFLFIKDNKILLEDRGVGFNNEAFFPSGAIELQDKTDDNYKVKALYREVSEEFNNQIKINKYRYLGEVDVPAINVLFYVFNIEKWEGEFPEVIKEEGEKDSVIKFFSFDEAKSLFKYNSCFEIMGFIDNL